MVILLPDIGIPFIYSCMYIANHLSGRKHTEKLITVINLVPKIQRVSALRKCNSNNSLS